MANNLKSKFEAIAKKISDTAVDFTTLEVTTLTGDVNQIINAQGKFKLKQDLIKTLGNKTGTTKGKIKLLAHTHIDFDHDTVNFVKSDLTDQEKDLFVLHESAIISAHEARKSFLRFLVEVLDSPRI